MTEEPPDAASGPRPQALLLVYFGDFVAEAAAGAGGLVASSSVVDLLGAAGVAEAAARATLARMTRRGLLRRELAGRRAFFGLTAQGRDDVLEGRRRFRDDSPTARAWDGTWTLVGFSLPETWQRERHDLRGALTAAGFGMVQAGLWVAPRRTDLSDVVTGPAVRERLRVFEGAPAPATDAAALVAEAWDLDALAARYTGFLDRWSGAGPDASPLARYVLLGADWLQVVRKDPRLPLALLPGDWPAVRAEALFRRLRDDLVEPAGDEFGATAELLPGT